MEMLLVCEYDLTYRDVKSTFIMFMPQIGFININLYLEEKSQCTLVSKYCYCLTIIRNWWNIYVRSKDPTFNDTIRLKYLNKADVIALFQVKPFPNQVNVTTLFVLLTPNSQFWGIDMMTHTWPQTVYLFTQWTTRMWQFRPCWSR